MIEPKDRLQECQELYAKWQSQFGAWIDKAKRSNTFLRGTHTEVRGSLQKDADTHDYLPEDRRATGDTKLYPSIPYTLSLLDQMVQYIRHDEGDVIVTSEGAFALAAIDPRLQAAGDVVQAKSQNELIAKMLTARLDMYRDRAAADSILDEVAHVAGAQRAAFVVVGWQEDETRQEPVTTKIIQPGRYWFDCEASKVADCDQIGYECQEDRDATAEKYGVELSGDENVWVRHFYTKDFTTSKVEQIEVEIEDEGVEVEQEPESVYKYPWAWRYTVTCGNKVLYDGEMETPGGRPPICVFTWRPLPHSMIGVSVMDSTETINRNIDRTVQYIMASAYRGLPKTAIDTARVESPDESEDNLPGGFLHWDSTKPGAGSPYEHLAGAPVPESLYTLLTTLKQLGAEMTGADGVAFEDASKFKLSGDAIEGLAQDRKGIAARVRDTWANFLADYYEVVLRFIMQNETDQVTVELPTASGTVQVTTEMPAYQFDDAEFEARFDVNVFSPQNMPKNPVRRAAYLLQVMNSVSEIAARDPQLARIYVQNADLPNSAELMAYLDTIQPAAPTGAGADVAAQVAAQQKDVTDRRAADVAKSVTDSMEKLAAEAAKAGQFDQAAAIIGGMPAASNKAYNEALQWEPPQIQPMMQ